MAQYDLVRLATALLKQNSRLQGTNLQLEQSQKLLRATMNSVSDGLLVVDSHQNIINYNQPFLELWEITPEKLRNGTGNAAHVFESLYSQIFQPEKLKNQFKQVAKKTNNTQTTTLKLLNGKIIESTCRLFKIDARIQGRVWCFHDITEQSFLQQKLKYQALHDPLTGLPNRLLLYDRMQQAIVATARNKTYFATLFLDLDGFKPINDTLSHHVGDALLILVADRLRASIRKQDTLARLGGDEFVVIIDDLPFHQAANTVAEKILSIFEQEFLINERKLFITASIGISVYPSNGTNSDTLLKYADIAMYEAKSLGGNQHKFYTHNLNERGKQRLHCENELRQALDNNQLFLMYQPQCDITTHKIVSMEAFIRWQHPLKGLIPPLEFIPLAEQTGLIIPIGEWVIDKVCQQINYWHTQGLPFIKIAVNVTSHQLRRSNFAQRVAFILQKNKLDPQYLEVEITEDLIITHFDILKSISALKKIGISIVIDDFRMGKTSLNCLKKTHIDRLKIDQSFVHNIDSSHNDEVIIKAIITMARSLDFQVVAEGVENQQQINFLKNNKCNDIQGYYFSKPLLPAAIEKFFKSNQDSL